MLKERAYFIAGINTDIGKSFLLEKLCKNFADNVLAIKPIASGVCDDDKNSDPARILTALGKKISKKNLDEISPWRFVDAVSPNFAAEKARKKIDFLAVKKFCEEKKSEAKKSKKFFFVEAAGGVMTPIFGEKTFLDLAQSLKLPVLLMSANYLGSISQTLCAVEALKSRKILVEKIIINEFCSDEKSSGVANSKAAQAIAALSKIPTVLLKEFS